MAKNSKVDMSCARVKKYTSSDVSKAERHNERKNETYENMNVIAERIPYNVHFKKPTFPTYMEQLKQMEQDGKVSLRGLRKDATLFNEIVIDVNTMYFERNGGYEYAKQFYEEAFHFIEEKFGADNVISAVMHADEINLAATEDLGKEVYHYHLHAMVLPVVEKEILWSKRCKDPELRGTVKEVVNQISHSKKWKSDIPLVDEKGNPLLRKNGKPMFRASYSILQDELFNHMTEKGFKGFQRGEYGSTAEHLTSLQYQIKQDTQRLDKLQQRIQKEQVKYKSSHQIFKTYNEIDSMGQKTFTGKMAISKEDYKELKPGKIAYYDGCVEVDLSEIRPMIAMPFHPSNTYTIDELKANLYDILDDVEKKAQISLDGKVPYSLKDKVVDGKLYVEQGIIAGCALSLIHI